MARLALRTLHLAVDAGRSHVQYLAGRVGRRQPLLGRLSAARRGHRLDHSPYGRLHRGGRIRRGHLQPATRVRVSYCVITYHEFLVTGSQRNRYPASYYRPRGLPLLHGTYRKRKRNWVDAVDTARDDNGVRPVGVLPLRLQGPVRQHSAYTRAARDSSRDERVGHPDAAPDSVVPAESGSHSADQQLAGGHATGRRRCRRRR